MKMMRRMILRVVIFLGILSMLFGNTGCSKNRFDEIVPVPFPEGATLTAFHLHHVGMMMEPYYILTTTEDGTYMKITNLSPQDWQMVDGEDLSGWTDASAYLAFADTVKACESASLVLLEDDASIKALEEAIAASGALAWNGYDESRKMKGVLDSGDRYVLYLELSDGTTVTMKGYNISPAGLAQLHSRTEEIFRSEAK